MSFFFAGNAILSEATKLAASAAAVVILLRQKSPACLTAAMLTDSEAQDHDKDLTQRT